MDKLDYLKKGSSDFKNYFYFGIEKVPSMPGSYRWSFSHSVPDPSSVASFLHDRYICLDILHSFNLDLGTRQKEKVFFRLPNRHRGFLIVKLFITFFLDCIVISVRLWIFKDGGS